MPYIITTRGGYLMKGNDQYSPTVKLLGGLLAASAMAHGEPVPTAAPIKPKEPITAEQVNAQYQKIGGKFVTGMSQALSPDKYDQLMATIAFVGGDANTPYLNADQVEKAQAHVEWTEAKRKVEEAHDNPVASGKFNLFTLYENASRWMSTSGLEYSGRLSVDDAHTFVDTINGLPADRRGRKISADERKRFGEFVSTYNPEVSGDFQVLQPYRRAEGSYGTVGDSGSWQALQLLNDHAWSSWKTGLISGFENVVVENPDEQKALTGVLERRSLNMDDGSTKVAFAFPEYTITEGDFLKFQQDLTQSLGKSGARKALEGIKPGVYTSHRTSQSYDAEAEKRMRDPEFTRKVEAVFRNLGDLADSHRWEDSTAVQSKWGYINTQEWEVFKEAYRDLHGQDGDYNFVVDHMKESHFDVKPWILEQSDISNLVVKRGTVDLNLNGVNESSEIRSILNNSYQEPDPKTKKSAFDRTEKRRTSRAAKQKNLGRMVREHYRRR